jgi:hypothetical protein
MRRRLIKDWGSRSEELRSAAAKTPDRTAKATMTGMAEAYEKLAQETKAQIDLTKVAGRNPL